MEQERFGEKKDLATCSFQIRNPFWEMMLWNFPLSRFLPGWLLDGVLSWRGATILPASLNPPNRGSFWDVHWGLSLILEVYSQNHAVEKIKSPDCSSPGCPGQSGPVWSLHSHQFNEVECVTVSGYSFIEIYEISLPLHNALADFPAVFF